MADVAPFDKGARILAGELRAVASSPTTLGASEDRWAADLSALMHTADTGSPPAVNGVIDALSTVALHHDTGVRAFGQRLIFGSLVESLSDSFEPAKERLCDALVARIVDRCRQVRTGRSLDRHLSRFGIDGPEAMLARKERITTGATFPIAERDRIRRVLVPSRVTVGADVAITSVVIQKIGRVFPRAECVVFGSRALAEILDGLAGSVRFVECAYPRRGDLMTRLEASIRLADLVESEIRSIEPGCCILVDPDSRLTQLGLLPVAGADIESFFFESRAYRHPEADSLGALTVRWLAETFGADAGEALYPKVVPHASDLAAARALIRRARAAGVSHVTTVTFGVGGNPRKRLEGRFEESLVRALLSDGGVVILDKGIDEEVARMEAIISALAAEVTTVVELEPNSATVPTASADGRLLVYAGGLRPLIGLAAASDLYVGYDSALQHMAAALAVPVIDVFANPPNDLFARRWRPYSKAAVQVVETDSDGAAALSRVLSAYERHRAASRSPATLTASSRS